MITSGPRYGDGNTILVDGPKGISNTVENIAGLPPRESDLTRPGNIVPLALSTANNEFAYTW